MGITAEIADDLSRSAKGAGYDYVQSRVAGHSLTLAGRVVLWKARDPRLNRVVAIKISAQQ